MEFSNTKRHYSEEEKTHLLANLDIEVEHRTRQFEAWLADRLENFNLHQEGHVSRIPKQVRSMTMREFGGKYGGNVQEALRGVQKEKFAAAGGEIGLDESDRNMRKRKWVASQDTDEEASKDQESSRAVKNARTIPNSPKKPGSSTGPGTAQHARTIASQKTPSSLYPSARIPPSPSPHKVRPPFNTNTSRSQSRPTSPVKAGPKSTLPPSRVPSSSTFNPILPPKTPAYPNGAVRNGPSTITRIPRKGESMLSLNGSPLANPFELGYNWFKSAESSEHQSDEEDVRDVQGAVGMTNGMGTLKKTKSAIVLRRDTSATYAPSNGGTDSGFHSRSNSQASLYTSSSSRTSSSSYSHDVLRPPPSHSQPTTMPKQPPQTTLPLNRAHSQQNLTTPKPTHTRSFSAMIAIPTKDGHVLEFDAVQTSPGALETLEGITDSAKKEARLEVGRLMQAAVEKWKVG